MQPLVDPNKARYEISKAGWVSFFPDQDPDILLAQFPMSVLMTINLRSVTSGDISRINKFLSDYISLYVRINWNQCIPARLIVGNGTDVAIPMFYDKAWASKANQMLEFMDLHESRHGRPMRVIDQLQWIIWKYKK